MPPLPPGAAAEPPGGVRGEGGAVPRGQRRPRGRRPRRREVRHPQKWPSGMLLNTDMGCRMLPKGRLSSVMTKLMATQYRPWSNISRSRTQISFVHSRLPLFDRPQTINPRSARSISLRGPNQRVRGGGRPGSRPDQTHARVLHSPQVLSPLAALRNAHPSGPFPAASLSTVDDSTNLSLESMINKLFATAYGLGR